MEVVHLAGQSNREGDGLVEITTSANRRYLCYEPADYNFKSMMVSAKG